MIDREDIARRVTARPGQLFLHFTNRRDAQAIRRSGMLMASSYIEGVYAVEAGGAYYPGVQQSSLGRVKNRDTVVVFTTNTPPDVRSSSETVWREDAIDVRVVEVLDAQAAIAKYLYTPEQCSPRRDALEDATFRAANDDRFVQDVKRLMGVEVRSVFLEVAAELRGGDTRLALYVDMPRGVDPRLPSPQRLADAVERTLRGAGVCAELDFEDATLEDSVQRPDALFERLLFTAFFLVHAPSREKAAGLDAYRDRVRQHRYEYGQRTWAGQLERLGEAAREADARMDARGMREALGALVRDLEALTTHLQLDPELGDLEAVTELQARVRDNLRFADRLGLGLTGPLLEALDALLAGSPALASRPYTLDVTRLEEPPSPPGAERTRRILEAMRRLAGTHAPEDIARRWAVSGERAVQGVTMMPVAQLWPLREYTWTRQTARSGMIKTPDGWVEVRGPDKWDILRERMARSGWSEREPLHLQVGRDGSVKVAEGNHRLAIARELGIPEVPVEVHYQDRVTNGHKVAGKPGLDRSQGH